MTDTQETKQTRRRTEEKEASPPEDRDLGAEEAREILVSSREMAAEGQRSLTRGVTTAAAAAEPAPADVTDELAKGGPAFGAFVKAVGLAIADAQKQLDQTLVDTAKALSETQIDVIAVFEQEINNDGEMVAGQPHVQKLPLVNYLMPTAYHWSRVFLEADMKVREFNVANGFNIQGKSSSFNVGASANFSQTGSLGASANVNFGTSSYQAAGGSSVSTDEAAGNLHIEATLEPRSDVLLPQPFIIQKGPRLKVSAGSRVDNTDSSGKLTSREITLTVELRDKANNVLAGKLLEFRISQPLLSYSATPADGKTDANGQLQIKITRTGAALDPTKPPDAVTVNVWLGLINEQVVVNI
jgi:hypothetical protein